jgi:transposase
MAKSTPARPGTRQGKLPASSAQGPKAARQRRLQAAPPVRPGPLPGAEIARRLQVSRQTTSRWHARWLAGGRAGLAGPGRWGRPSRLTDRDWRRVEQALLRGAQAHGFDTDLWTLPRVAEVIWRTCGVSYHPGHVWWLLRRHQWSPQRPARRASERDEAEIARWREQEWPRIKKGHSSKARGSALSTSPAPR